MTVYLLKQLEHYYYLANHMNIYFSADMIAFCTSEHKQSNRMPASSLRNSRLGASGFAPHLGSALGSNSFACEEVPYEQNCAAIHMIQHHSSMTCEIIRRLYTQAEYFLRHFFVSSSSHLNIFNCILASPPLIRGGRYQPSLKMHHYNPPAAYHGSPRVGTDRLRRRMLLYYLMTRGLSLNDTRGACISERWPLDNLLSVHQSVKM